MILLYLGLRGGGREREGEVFVLQEVSLDISSFCKVWTGSFLYGEC